MPGDLAAAIYGLITVGALLAAEQARRETYAKTIAAVILTLLMYWVAHSYAEFTSWRLKENKPLAAGDLVRELVNQLPLLLGASLPLLALLIEWAVGASLSAAVSAAIWTSTGAVILIEIVAGRRADLSGGALVLQAGVGALLGVMIALLRVLLH
jgi:positive regulator of sigma E activity